MMNCVKTTYLAMLMSMGAAVAAEGEAPQFAVTHMEIEFPRQALQLSDNHRKSFMPMPLMVDFFLNADDLELRSVKNCRLIDAEERDLQARFLYSGGRFFRVKAGEEVYPHGEWVEVQGIAEVQPKSGKTEDVMLTTEDGQAPCRYAASYHPGKNGITNMKIYAVFDGKPQHFKLSFKTQKASGVRRIPFSYKVSVGGARQQHP